MITKEELEKKKIKKKEVNGKYYYLASDIKKKLTNYKVIKVVGFKGTNYVLLKDIQPLSPFDKVVKQILLQKKSTNK